MIKTQLGRPAAYIPFRIENVLCSRAWLEAFPHLTSQPLKHTILKWSPSNRSRTKAPHLTHHTKEENTPQRAKQESSLVQVRHTISRRRGLLLGSAAVNAWGCFSTALLPCPFCDQVERQAAQHCKSALQAAAEPLLTLFPFPLPWIELGFRVVPIGLLYPVILSWVVELWSLCVVSSLDAAGRL